MNDNTQRSIFLEGVRWCKHNVCLSTAIISAYPQLSARELALLIYIASWSEREKACQSEYTDIALSYNDIQTILKLKYPTQAARIVKRLVNLELIIVNNSNDRKGRARSVYLPNVNKIRSAISEYLKLNPLDKET